MIVHSFCLVQHGDVSEFIICTTPKGKNCTSIISQNNSHISLSYLKIMYKKRQTQQSKLLSQGYWQKDNTDRYCWRTQQPTAGSLAGSVCGSCHPGPHSSARPLAGCPAEALCLPGSAITHTFRMTFQLQQSQIVITQIIAGLL